jgi:SAM-dependent methyltransferase
MSSSLYDQVGSYYDADAGDFDSRYWKNPVLQQLRQAFREEVMRNPFSDALEVGCGTGIDLVHFGTCNPGSRICGIDISPEMARISSGRIAASHLGNIEVHAATVEAFETLFPARRFDLIYVFFGALNTVDDLSVNARILNGMLTPGGRMVLTFVNKWYLGGIALELIRFRFRRAFARLKPVWGGYSPSRHLPSRCYTPAEVQKAFRSLTMTGRHGYSILHPAWYFTGINRKLGKAGRLLWKADIRLSRTPLWRFGEYTLFTFQKTDGMQQH